MDIDGQFKKILDTQRAPQSVEKLPSTALDEPISYPTDEQFMMVMSLAMSEATNSYADKVKKGEIILPKKTPTQKLYASFKNIDAWFMRLGKQLFKKEQKC